MSMKERGDMKMQKMGKKEEIKSKFESLKSTDAIIKSLSNLNWFIIFEMDNPDGDIPALAREAKDNLIKILKMTNFSPITLTMMEASFYKCIEHKEEGRFDSGTEYERLKCIEEVMDAAVKAGGELDPSIQEEYESMKREMERLESERVQELVKEGKITVQ